MSNISHYCRSCKIYFLFKITVIKFQQNTVQQSSVCSGSKRACKLFQIGHNMPFKLMVGLEF